MKLIRFGEPGKERPGVWIDPAERGGKAQILDVREMGFDIETYDEHFFETQGLARLRNLLEEDNKKLIPIDGVRLGPPIARPSKIMCLAGNYEEHVEESRLTKNMPDNPVVFCKATTAITGPNDPIVLPKDADMVDLEVELAIVIGKRCRGISKKEAMDHIAGYMILNDVSDRDVQESCRQFFCGKSPDTFCPVGPYLVTRDEVRNVKNLNLVSIINGKVLQDGNTKEMIYQVPQIVEFLAKTITLLPGDVIATGTPAGVGSAREEPIVLKEGDKIKLSVKHLGTQENEVVRVES